MNPIGGGAGGAGSVQQIMEMRQQLLDKSKLLQELHEAKAGAPAEPEKSAGGGFADTLKTALDGVSASQSKAGELTEAYERGEVTDIAKVMLARQEAGVAFEATLQVRNKLLSAYQEIMRIGV
ncbi:flagellar hook-basal body complex protein FliE [Altererythrobacter atlanticus]|uniref:Flagellar hook-basal body complex protein FliE n=1 Tax=Croceibacterium atlanticum TaxID=1267766 RepID=A0A0F7KY72_9SPHN|nr:flagellar hook-basal body complex protein FliE [Croceibacterium atlanticum]AKH44167.1 Flagellar hook-basal body complex protein FliE [Croceibacterium atlanticum]MBB5732478.1 flagellar hook-basal body complex protein FliE [Croceibacterium atlanticum]